MQFVGNATDLLILYNMNNNVLYELCQQNYHLHWFCHRDSNLKRKLYHAVKVLK